MKKKNYIIIVIVLLVIFGGVIFFLQRDSGDRAVAAPSDITTKEDCVEDGFYWYGEACHATPQEEGDWSCGKRFKDERDGSTYSTIEIGDQCWMAENINYKDHDKGESWCYEDEEEMCEKYGRLYDWDAAMSVCPPGWKLPSDDDWKKLEGYVDSTYDYENEEWDQRGYRGDDAGDLIKDPDHEWCDSDSCGGFGFNAFPAGDRMIDGEFRDLGDFSSWWTSDEDRLDAWNRVIDRDHPSVNRHSISKEFGISVRCVVE